MFAWRLFVLMKRRLLWRVRRKLILSYIFIGVVPALLIIVFFLLGGMLVFMNVSAYLFKDGYDAIVDDVRLSAQAAATEIARNARRRPTETFERVHRIRPAPYPALSLAYRAGPDGGRQPSGRRQRAAGAATHVARLADATTCCAGVDSAWPIGRTRRDDRAASADRPGEVELVVRAARPVVRGGAVAGFVIVDLPIDARDGAEAPGADAACAPARPRCWPTARTPMRQPRDGGRSATPAAGGPRCSARA